VLRHAGGASAREVAQQFGLSERQVWRILGYWADSCWPYEEVI
jgi:transposase